MSSRASGRLLARLPRHFLDRRVAVLHLAQAALTQGEHPFLDGLPAQLQRGRADEDELAQLLRDLHDLVETHPSLVARVVALVAPGALLRHHAARLAGIEAR